MVYSKIVPKSQLDSILNDTICTKFNIQKPVLQLNSLRDKSGQYYIILSQRILAQYADKDSLNNSIRFMNLQIQNKNYSKVWDYTVNALPDFIVGTQSINFNMQIVEFLDYDNDSIIDPIISYSTKTEFHLLIFYKNKITHIDLRFSTSKYRIMDIQDTYYKLPLQIQNAVICKLDKLFQEKPDEFPTAWKRGIKKKKNQIRSKG